MLNTDRVGHRYPPYTYEVGREKVREYAVATHVGDDRLRPAGSDTVLVPPTFAACVAGARAWSEVVADPKLGATDNLIHGSQEFEFHRPLQVGDVLTCTPVVADIRSRRGIELLTLEVECVDPHGTPVLTSRAVLVFVEERE